MKIKVIEHHHHPMIHIRVTIFIMHRGTYQNAGDIMLRDEQELEAFKSKLDYDAWEKRPLEVVHSGY